MSIELNNTKPTPDNVNLYPHTITPSKSAGKWNGWQPYVQPSVSSLTAFFEQMTVQTLPKTEPFTASSVQAVLPQPPKEQKVMSSYLKMVEESLTHTQLLAPTKKVVLDMGEMLERYVQESVVPKIKEKADQERSKIQGSAGEEKKLAAIDAQERAEIEKAIASMNYFAMAEEDLQIGSPLERIAKIFEDLPAETDAAAVQSLLKKILKRGYDQHLDNPEQYVSHGLDHSLNVMDYAAAAIDSNPFLIQSMQSKYGVSAGEGKFLLKAMALLHDIGYPCVGCRQKSVHGIAGADLFDHMQASVGKVLSSNLEEAQKQNLLNDFRDAILFHSADKVDHEFTTKIHTTTGTFLADHGNLARVISIFQDPSQDSIIRPEKVIVIEASEDIVEDVEQALKEAQEYTFQKTGLRPQKPEVRVIPSAKTFPGRYADLIKNKDNLVGLEFSVTDLKDRPFDLIRLVDNMDMRKNRLSPIQREEAFHEIYHMLGNDQTLSLLSQKLEALENQWKKSPGDMDEVRKMAKTFLEALKTEQESNQNVSSFIQVFDESSVDEAKTPGQLRGFLNEALVKGVLSQDRFQSLPAETRAQIAKYGVMLSSYDLRHFGGCEGITDVRLEQIAVSPDATLPVVKITTDPMLFTALNKVRVVERSITGVELNVGVGEYQVWRALDAYASINIDKQPVVIFIDGQKVTTIGSNPDEKLYDL